MIRSNDSTHRSPGRRAPARAAALLAALAAALAGCSSTDDPPAPGSRAHDAWVGDALSAASAARAVAAERSLHAHDFELDSAELSGLGRRHLAVLAQHVSETGGRIAVRAGGAPPELHEARLARVRSALEDLGVPADRIAVEPALPGGSGIASTRVVAILAAEAAGASATVEGTAGPTAPVPAPR